MPYLYQGDRNLEYGGSFIDISTFPNGYCTAVRVTDLDSGCGFRGAIMIEHVVINGTTDRQRVRQAIASCGGLARFPNRECVRHWVADCLLNYGFFDPDNSWDGYQSFHTEILQLEPDGPMTFDGWRADKRLHNTDLRDYVESVHLR